jgi:hypothetical protein
LIDIVASPLFGTLVGGRPVATTAGPDGAAVHSQVAAPVRVVAGADGEAGVEAADRGRERIEDAQPLTTVIMKRAAVQPATTRERWGISTHRH